MRKAKKDEGSSWMDTYGDMVTLLLCFFVLLYAISAVDQTKWMNLVKSLNPEAESSIQDAVDNADKDNTVTPDVIPADLDTLVDNIQKEIDAKDLNTQIEVKSGEGYTFITFNSSLIFDPDSYVLKEEIKGVLDSFCEILAPFSSEIQQIQILGHTAEANPGQNNIINDRFLSSNRAAAVLVYIQQKNIVDPVKLVSIGYGQYRPIEGNDTPEGRAVNRRVEVLITKNDTVQRSLDDYYGEVYENLPASAGNEADAGNAAPSEGESGAAAGGESPSAQDAAAETGVPES